MSARSDRSRVELDELEGRAGVERSEPGGRAQLNAGGGLAAGGVACVAVAAVVSSRRGWSMVRLIARGWEPRLGSCPGVAGSLMLRAQRRG